MSHNIYLPLIISGGMLALIALLSWLGNHYTLNNIKSKTVGDGQYGTARWATPKEIRKTYAHVSFRVADWRRGKNRPTQQGLVLDTTTLANISSAVYTAQTAVNLTRTVATAVK